MLIKNFYVARLLEELETIKKYGI